MEILSQTRMQYTLYCFNKKYLRDIDRAWGEDRNVERGMVGVQIRANVASNHQKVRERLLQTPLSSAQGIGLQAFDLRL